MDHTEQFRWFPQSYGTGWIILDADSQLVVATEVGQQVNDHGRMSLGYIYDDNFGSCDATALLDAEVDALESDKSGWTPLHYTANFISNSDIVTVLFPAGVDPSVCDDNGWIHLDYTLAYGTHISRHSVIWFIDISFCYGKKIYQCLANKFGMGVSHSETVEGKSLANQTGWI